jgi:mannose-6-phosphate isomerase-like protein (cupin superfamily)
MEKHYVVLDGELTVTGEIDGCSEQATLRRHDSVRFAPGEKRQLRNHTDQPASVLLAMPIAPPAGA